MINGGKRNDINQNIAGSSLLPLDATAEQSSSCSPPNDMIDERKGHMALVSGGNLVVCGGSDTLGRLDKCEEYDKEQDEWSHVANKLEEDKTFFPSIQLTEDKIWMGRKPAKKSLYENLVING